MNLNLNEDQRLLKDTVARLFRTESSPERVRQAEASGFDPALWDSLVQMGIPSMRVPGASGGADMSLLDAVLVAEEAGRYLASVPIVENIVAASLLAALDSDEARIWLEEILNGGLVTLYPRPLQIGDDHAFPAGTAAHAVLALRDDAVVVLRPTDAAQRRANLGSEALAPSLPLDASDVVAAGPQVRDAFLAAIEEWKLLTAALLIGLGRQALDLSAAYCRERQQFGQPIGSYQGIAHPLADALVEVEGARLLVWRAAWAIGAQRSDAAAAVSMAYWWATQSVPRATAKALHSFGGYGVSLEYDIQLYYRRGKAWSLRLGDPGQELYCLADRLWGAGETPLPAAGAVAIEFGLGSAAQAFAAQARQFFEDNLTPELRAHAHHSVAGFHPAFNRTLAKAGLLFPHWPVEYGGQNRSPFEQAALAEVYESFGWERITAPITNQVAQIVMQFGSDEVKREVLPRFAAGEALACLGFSEPDAGSDVFAARTRALRDGDDWLISGQKIFTTAANLASYVFLLTRTDPDAAKHAGLTLFLVPLDAPGVVVQGVETLQDERTNITYYDNVRVHDRYRLGEVNGGIKVMAATLELEHGGDQYRLNYSNMLRHVTHWATHTQRYGIPAIQQPDVRRRLARVVTHATLAESLCHRAIWAMSEKVPERASYGPMSKLFSTEFYQRDASDLMDLAAPHSLFAGGDDLGQIEIGYRQSIGMTIYGGTSEIHRSLIAEKGLGLPRSRS